MKSSLNAWRSNKFEVKKCHYKPYEIDEEMTQNKPHDIPLEEFKSLLGYWGDPKVEEIPKRYAPAQRKITNTHTAGPKPFAQIRNELKLATPDGKGPSKAEMFIATRKHKEGHEYMSKPDVMNYRLACTTKKIKAQVRR